MGWKGALDNLSFLCFWPRVCLLMIHSHFVVLADCFLVYDAIKVDLFIVSAVSSTYLVVAEDLD